MKTLDENQSQDGEEYGELKQNDLSTINNVEDVMSTIE